MLHHPRSLARCVAVGLAACAIAPAAASAVPADSHTAGPPTLVHARPDLAARHHNAAQDLTAPDQVDRVDRSPAPSSAPTGPQPRLVSPGPTPTTVKAPSHDGSDVGLIAGLCGGALLLVGGLGVAGRKHTRQRQLA